MDKGFSYYVAMYAVWSKKNTQPIIFYLPMDGQSTVWPTG